LKFDDNENSFLRFFVEFAAKNFFSAKKSKIFITTKILQKFTEKFLEKFRTWYER